MTVAAFILGAGVLWVLVEIYGRLLKLHESVETTNIILEHIEQGLRR